MKKLVCLFIIFTMWSNIHIYIIYLDFRYFNLNNLFSLSRLMSTCWKSIPALIFASIWFGESLLIWLYQFMASLIKKAVGFGSVSRISPEAPVPVINVKSESYTLGGAGNVVNNIKGLTADIYIFTKWMNIFKIKPCNLLFAAYYS